MCSGFFIENGASVMLTIIVLVWFFPDSGVATTSHTSGTDARLVVKHLSCRGFSGRQRCMRV